MKKQALLALALFHCCISSAFSDEGKVRGNNGETRHPHRQKATGHDFKGEKVVKVGNISVGSLKADLNCEKMYDSADPASMLLELGMILGPAVILGKVPALSGFDDNKSKQLFSDLRTLAKHKVWLPVSMEKKVGDLLHNMYVDDRVAIDPDQLNRSDRARFKRVQGILDGILKNLPEDNPYEFRLGIITGDEFNATVNPGGYIYVTQGLLRDVRLKDDELAIILAHEVAHVTKRHALKEWQIKLVDSMELGKDLKAALKLTSEPGQALNNMLKTLGTGRMLFQTFDHAQEFEGDACGIPLAAGNKAINVEKGVNQFAKRHNARPKPKSWGESHPSSEERVALMNKQLIRVKNGALVMWEDDGAAPNSNAISSSAKKTNSESGFFGGLRNIFRGSSTSDSDVAETKGSVPDVALSNKTEESEHTSQPTW